MKILIGIAAILGTFAGACAAQNFLEPQTPEQKKIAAKTQIEIDQMLKGAKVLSFEAGIMGPAVKGAPYSADEIHETNQVLADGTKIHNETKVTVYRDSQGRVRRESPGQVMIWDSTAGTSYVLNQSSQTAQKMQMAVNYTIRKTFQADGSNEPASFRTFQFSGDGGAPDTAHQMVVVKGMGAQVDIRPQGVAGMKEGQKETLPSQIIEGLTCEGARLTRTIEAGAIGNDRPIQSVEERWYSSELQLNLLVRKTDPRTGEDTVRLTNVRRLEPDPSLFTVPSNYQLQQGPQGQQGQQGK